jgi:hypothetical protein
MANDKIQIENVETGLTELIELMMKNNLIRC